MHGSAKTKAFIFAVVYLFFLAMLNYPYLAGKYNARIQGKCIAAYERDVKAADHLSDAKEKARAYNRALRTGTDNIRDAFSREGEEEETYLSLLSVNRDRTMGTLRIPAIQLELPVYHGTSETVLQKGAGHLEGSSLPIGGKGTHACISAHRGLPNKQMFTNLDLLQKGDLFFITVLDELLAYRIFDIRTVLPDKIKPLGIKKNRDLVTLITCTPYGINTHRLYVTGTRIPYSKINESEEQRTANWWALNWNLPVTGILLVFLALRLRSYVKSQNRLSKGVYL